MKMPRAERLRGQRRAEPVEGLLGQKCVVDHAGQVCHPAQRRQLRPYSRQQLADLTLVADVGGKGVDPAVVALRHLVDDLLGCRIGRPPAGQDDVSGAELRQIRCRVQAERAEAAGDQVAPIFARLQRIRHLQHDLADVPRLLHAPERRLRLRQRIDLDGSGVVSPLANPLDTTAIKSRMRSGSVAISTSSARIS